MIPTIDISDLRSSNLSDRMAVAHRLGDACRNIGFFYVTGHSISRADFGDLFSAVKTFFALPTEKKRRLSHRNSKNGHGYMELMSERLDPSSMPDRKESFGIGLEFPAGHPRANSRFYGGNQWPDIPGWRDIVQRHFNACWNLGRLLHQGFSLDLGVDELFFEPKLDAPIGGLRLLHYPPAGAGSIEFGDYGAGEHTDYGNVTILTVDGVGGLQLRTRDETWIDATSIDGAVICNIGDCLMRWTNDVYVSTPHRVKAPLQNRYSVAFFLDPNPEAEVSPIAGDEASRQKYPPISGSDYLMSRLAATLISGQ